MDYFCTAGYLEGFLFSFFFGKKGKKKNYQIPFELRGTYEQELGVGSSENIYGYPSQLHGPKRLGENGMRWINRGALVSVAKTKATDLHPCQPVNQIPERMVSASVEMQGQGLGVTSSAFIFSTPRFGFRRGLETVACCDYHHQPPWRREL